METISSETGEVYLKKEGNIYIMYLNAVSNNFNFKFCRKINEQLDIVEATTGAACLVTTSTNEKFFSTGLDLAFLNNEVKENDDRVNFLQEFIRLLGRLLTFPIPTVAAINGHCIAGGMMLAMAHDFRVMRQDFGFLCMSEINIGLTLPDGMCAVVGCKLTPRVMSECVLTGKKYPGKEALRLGMVDKLSPKEGVLNDSIAIAQEMLPKVENRDAYHGIKKTLYRREYDICMNRGIDDDSVRILKYKFNAKL